jgi:hypothetical protein
MVRRRLGYWIMKVKTIRSEQVWQSSDGKRTIWEVTVAADGKEYMLKTYSDQIKTIGWEGEVRSYVNERGDRFLRQVPGDDKQGRYKRDDSSIKAQWAIGQAINLASVKMDKEQITLPVIVKYAKELYAAVAQIKGEEPNEDDLAMGNKLIDGLAGAE